MKHCLKEPIPEIFEVAEQLIQAVQFHKNGDFKTVEEIIIQTNLPIIREWTESIWGLGGIFSNFKKSLGEPTQFPPELRDSLRMPTKKGEQDLLERDGHFCRFCGIPVMRKEIRSFLQKQYPSALQWGKTNNTQHAAFQAMWVQYDHLVPHARGGKTTLENMLITCAPCNYGRMNYLIEEVGISLLEKPNPVFLNWDGLESILEK